MHTNPFYQKLGYVLFLFGALAGLLFNALATWADFEAANYNVRISSDSTLPSLRCPVLLSSRERGLIRARFDNPTGQKLTRRIRIYVSQKQASEMQEQFVTLPLAPGESKSLAWAVDSQNTVWERLILARVYQNRNHPLPSRSSACGVLVADLLGLPGAWVSGLAVVGSASSLLAGFLLWKRNTRPGPGTSRQTSNRGLSMQALAVFVMGGFLATLLGQWMLGLILVVIAVLLVFTVMAQSQLL